MAEDNLDIDDILENVDKPKKINSGGKGKRHERQLVQVLNDRFADILSKNPSWGQFSRSVGSGNRYSQNVILGDTSNQIFSGDIVVPPTFRFVLENKGGYNDIDLISALDGHKEIDKFLKQVGDDSIRCGRLPMLIWRKDRKPRLVIINNDVCNDIVYLNRFNFKQIFKYKNEWSVFYFDDLMNMSDDFFFTNNKIVKEGIKIWINIVLRKLKINKFTYQECEVIDVYNNLQIMEREVYFKFMFPFFQNISIVDIFKKIDIFIDYLNKKSIDNNFISINNLDGVNTIMINNEYAYNVKLEGTFGKKIEENKNTILWILLKECFGNKGVFDKEIDYNILINFINRL